MAAANLISALVRTNLSGVSTAFTALVLAAIVAATAPAPAATVDLMIDGAVPLRAAEVKPLQGGMVSVTLQQAPNEPLVLPAERVRCAGAQCPQQLAMQGNGVPEGFQIQGSNTIGDSLMPGLVTEFLKQRIKTSPRETVSSQDDAQKTVSFEPRGGERVDIVITAKGSGTGFAFLMGEAQPPSQIWMASRPANKIELEKGRKLGVDFTAPENEHILALDGLAIIVNNKNPLTSISTDELAQIFSGKITRWEDLKSGSDSSGHPTYAGEIKLYRRDNKSGTTATFNDLVFSPYYNRHATENACMAALANDLGACFSPKAASYEVTNQLTADVESDPYGIGYVGIGFRDNTKPLGIVVDCATGPSGAPHRFVYSPNDFNIKTEEYPLSRRLYLYTRGKPTNVLASGLVEFAQSKDAGETIRKTGFYDSTIMEAEFSTLGDRFVSMISAVGTNDMQTHDFLSDILFATRLSTTLRFADKAAKLDNKALDDILSLADALNHTYKGRQFIIAGFSDSMDDPERARQLSADRAVAVATALMAQHVTVFRGNVHAYGAAAPVACEDSEAGRVLNRRVEIWVK